MDTLSYLPVTWPEALQTQLAKVKACTTLKYGGASSGNFSAFNLATHVDDKLTAVMKNRQKLFDDLKLPSEPIWLEQVHSNTVVLAENTVNQPADASVTQVSGVVCAVLTADCLPVFFCNLSGSEVAIAHAGWRGLHAGIISKIIAAMSSKVDEILVHLGPAIGPQSFEVGMDVFNAFVESNPENKAAFVATSKKHYLCDLYQLARIELQSLGIQRITGGDYCTYQDHQQFYSFRRSAQTGRMASLIWID